MIEIIFYGRGGWGAALAAQILADAAAKKDCVFSHAFPFFGSERRGAPLKSFVRIDGKYIRLKCQIKKADVLVVFTESLLEIESTEYKPENNLKEKGLILLNSRKKAPDLVLPKTYKIKVFDATTLAKKYGLGKKIPIVNTIMLGALSALNLEFIDFSGFKEALNDRLSPDNLKELRENCKESIAKTTALVELENLIEAAQFNLPAEIEKNLKAMREAYDICKTMGVNDGKNT